MPQWQRQPFSLQHGVPHCEIQSCSVNVRLSELRLSRNARQSLHSKFCLTVWKLRSFKEPKSTREESQSSQNSSLVPEDSYHELWKSEFWGNHSSLCYRDTNSWQAALTSLNDLLSFLQHNRQLLFEIQRNVAVHLNSCLHHWAQTSLLKHKFLWETFFMVTTDGQ